MKVLLVDTALDGHHPSYISGLMNITGIEFILVAPAGAVGKFQKSHKIYEYDFDIKRKKYSHYRKWLKFIKNISVQEEVDVIHFLDGDTVMRFFGAGLKSLKKKILITYHHYFGGRLREISYKRMARNSSEVIVHTDTIYESIKSIRIKNAELIGYPVFAYSEYGALDATDCKKHFNLPQDKLILGMIGTTNSYKGYDDILNAFKNGKFDNLHLFIVGREGDFKRTQIEEMAGEADISSTVLIKDLSDAEYNMAVMASDVVLLAYKKSFDGASGPLAEGACCGKVILSSGHGSLGNLVKNNHIGFTFDSADELVSILNDSGELAKFSYDEKATDFRLKLTPERFAEAYFKLYNSAK